MNNIIFIPFNTPSLKNGKIKTQRGIFSSVTVKKYLQKLGIQTYSVGKQTVKGYVNRPNLFAELIPEFQKAFQDKSPPYKVGFHFVRNSKRKFDFNNANQLIADLLIAHKVLEDDNMDYFIPYAFKLNDDDLNYYSINTENPGVYVRID